MVRGRRLSRFEDERRLVSRHRSPTATMNHQPTLLRRAVTSPSGGKPDRSGLGIPHELLRRSRERLAGVSLLFGGLSALTMLILWPLGIAERGGMPIHVTVVVLSALVYTASKAKRAISDGLALHLGLAFLVASTFLTSVFVLRLNYLHSGNAVEPLWTCITMVAFPLIVPMPPKKIAIALVIAVLTVPLGFIVLQATTDYVLREGDLVSLMISPVFTAFISYYGSHVVHGYGVEVAKARELGAYRLESQLGVGGMGEVWRASHRMLARPAAVKLIRPEILDERDPGSRALALRRFEREAQVTANLKSPHAVVLYDYGVAGDGSLYYVMELLEGYDLDELVRTNGPLAAERAIYLLRQACRALEEAHRAKLIHRDIKPSNLFICRHGIEADFVKVLDFGLVTLQREWTTEAADLTGEGGVLGTPAFLAPEMAANPDAADGRSDIYSLGCVAFWLLTGQSVFTASTPIGVILAHVNEAPRAPSANTEIEIPAALDALVLRCLSKDPADRPATAAEMEALLGEIDVDRAWTSERAERWWDAHVPRPASGASPGV